MGQYYKPINVTKKEWLYSHEYDNGLKLMEHSYIGNNFTETVAKLLCPKGAWYKDSIVWAGDYADGKVEAHSFPIWMVIFKDAGLTDSKRYGIFRTGALMTFSDPNEAQKAKGQLGESYEVTRATVQVEEETEANLYSQCEETGKIKPKGQRAEKYRYLCNHTLKEYVDLTTLKEDGESTGFTIHPLPLLTCEGNGRGGGDHHKEDERVGSWARHSISFEEAVPENYQEVNGQFYE